MSASKPKRVKHELSVADKYEILRYHDSHPHVNQVGLKVYFEKEFNTTIGKSTISELLSGKNKKTTKSLKDKILSLNDVENDPKMRIKEARYPELVKCLMYWYNEYHYRIPISDSLMTEKAKDFGNMLGICEQSFKYSIGWLEKVKIRNKL